MTYMITVVSAVEVQSIEGRVDHLISYQMSGLKGELSRER